MNYKYFIFLFVIFLYSCEHHKTKIIYKKDTKNIIKANDKIKTEKKDITKKKLNENKLKIYNNKGFALIYDDDLFKNKIVNKKINSNSVIIFNNILIKNSPIKITNLINGKSLISRVENDINYPHFYNSLISQRIVDELSIDKNEPYVKIETLNSNSVYVANEAKTFDEEKNVANKAPVDIIKIQNIGITKSTKKQKNENKNKKFNYIIKFAELYFEESANMLKDRLTNEYNINDISIKKLSTNSYRVFKGPYNNLESLKNAYNDIGIINFEDIEIIKL